MKIRTTRSVVAGAALGSVAFAPLALAQDTGNALPEIVVLAPTPVPGGGTIEVDKIPAFVSTVTAQQFADRYSPAVTDALTAHVPAAIAISVDGSDLSPDLYYRGFDASRISGTAEGLAIYQNGVRINEAFGDSVNLDLVPPIAVDHADVYTNNPIFGLNALGGAINFTMKNGFTYQGGEASILGGSYGRVWGNFQYGKQIGDYSLYIAGDALRDDGYRPFGSSNLQRGYADLGYRTQDSEFHAIASFGRSLLGVQGTTPEPLVQQQYNSVFTTPQTTNNQAGLAQITAKFDLTPTWSVASNFYYRQFDQYHVDGNDADITDCGDQGGIAGNACLPTSGSFSGNPNDFQFTNHGQPIPYLGDSFPYGTTANTATHTNTFGTQIQATDKEKLFGHDNYFVMGGSVDQSYTHFSSTTTLGILDPQFQNIYTGFPGSEAQLETQGNVGFNSVWVHSSATYFGLFTLDTFNITKELAVTAGARYNVANIDLSDASGEAPNLNSSNSYSRINPVFGLTYTVSPALTFYGGYSEANRAPTPLESSCSNPQQPCLLETALVSDPPLQQVVSHTFEGGVRGTVVMPTNYGALAYKIGFFHTTSTNDIVSEASPISGQGFFTNVPETLRQGVEVGLQYNNGPLSIYGNYAHVDATYQFNATFSSPNNPFADADGNIFVRPGDRIPGIPANIGKLGAEYALTPSWKLGFDAIFVGSQYYVGDDSNQNPQLPFYYVVNLHSSYQINDHVQIFGLINNLFNRQYATFGTFFDTGTTGGNVNQILFNNNPDNGGPGDARAVTVAQPISFYAGVKVTF